MTTWSTAEALIKDFAVSAHALRSHAERGNVAMMRTALGTRMFDEQRVAAIFRRRDQDPHELGLATLGLCELGRQGGPPPRRGQAAPVWRSAWL
ncbi:MAG: hypothetical protein JWN04_6618 [Myxococcaceae bacterium]|nr:hypothetical protein [Myxococcaceae bacterium]